MKKSLHMYLLIASLLISAALQLIDKHIVSVPEQVAIIGVVISIACLIASIVLWIRQGKQDEFYK